MIQEVVFVDNTDQYIVPDRSGHGVDECVSNVQLRSGLREWIDVEVER